MEQIHDILLRIKSAIGARTDKEMCEILEIPYGTLDNWKTRKKIPKARLFEIAQAINLPVEFLLNGNMQILNNNNAIINSSNNNIILGGQQNNISKEDKNERDYVAELIKEFADEKILKWARNRLLLKKYGTFFDKRVTLDDMGIIIYPYAGFDSDFEESLNLIEKTYRLQLSEKELLKQCKSWLEYRVPALTLWTNLGISIAEARKWRLELEIPYEELEKIAEKLAISTLQIMPSKKRAQFRDEGQAIKEYKRKNNKTSN